MPPAVRALLLLLLLMLLLGAGSASSAGAFALIMKLICEGTKERGSKVRHAAVNADAASGAACAPQPLHPFQ